MKLYIEDNETIPAVKILEDAAPAPSGFTDKTDDLISWRDHGQRACSDFIQFKKYVTEAMNTKTWSSLLTAEKDFITDNYIREDGISSTNDGTRKVVHLMSPPHLMSQPEAVAYLHNVWAEYHIKEIAACQARATSKTIFLVLPKYLSLMDASDFTNVIQQPYYMYTTQAIKGVNDGEAGEGFFDFIESTAGTSYETAGLAQQGYAMANGDPDMSNFITELMNVLRDGNYES